MSLFDLLKSNDPAVAQGLLQAGLSLLSSKGKFGSALGGAGLAGLQGANQYKQMQFQRQLQESQLDDMKRRKMQQMREDDLANLPGKFIVPPSQPGMEAPGGMETALEAPQNQASPAGRMDLGGLAQAFMAAPGGLQQGLSLSEWLKKRAPQVQEIDPTKNYGTFDGGKFNPVLTGTPKADPTKMTKIAQLLAEMDALPPGDPMRALYAKALAKETSHAPAANIKIDNKMGEGLAKEVGPMVADSAGMAKGAQQAITNADSIIRAIDSNKVFTGPGATVRLRGAQIGQMLGVSGKDANETIANTRSLIQGLAQSTVAARAALKGQGAVSDFEGKLLQQAASGNIDDMTASEVKVVVQVNKRLAELQLKNHAQLIGKLKGHAGTAQIADLFDVPTQDNQTVDWNDLGRNAPKR